MLLRGLDRWPLPFPRPFFSPEGDGAPAPGPTGAAPGPTGAAGATAAAPGPTGDGGAVGGAGATGGGATGAGGAGPTNFASGTGSTGDARPPADFPADWRERMARNADGTVDAKELERLKRVAAPTDLWKNYKELDARLNSRTKDTAMPDAATDPEGNKKWREERSIPLDATGYQLPEDITKRLLPIDKPVLQNFTEFAAKKGARQDVVQLGTEWYLEQEEQRVAAVKKLDDDAVASLEDTMRKKWGDDYRPNRAAVERYAKDAVPGVNWFEARLPNDPERYGKNAGMQITNIPGVVEALAKFARLEYGDEAFVGGEAAKATTSRMAELKTIMDTDFDRWEKSPDLKKEYYGLLEAAGRNAGSLTGRGA